MITTKDYWLGALIGLVTGVLVLFIIFRLSFSFPYEKLALLVMLPIALAFGVWFGGFLSKWMPFFAQFGKYAAAGFLSTAIDFGVLNYVSYVTGITAGLTIGWINMPGFAVAVFNGYLWNKLWVFNNRNTENAKVWEDFPKFFIVAAIGLVLNSAVIVLLTTYIPISTSISQERWLNIAKIAASAVVIIWNFIGFKFIAFREKKL